MTEGNETINRDYFEEKFAHVFTKLAMLLKRQDSFDQGHAGCLLRCNSEMESVFERLRKQEIDSEVRQQWIDRHDKEKDIKAALGPHWWHVYGVWVTLAVMLFSILGTFLGTRYLESVPSPHHLIPGVEKSIKGGTEKSINRITEKIIGGSIVGDKK